MSRPLTILSWTALALAVLVPVTAATFSPLLAWRQPIYIGAGFAGIIGLALLLVQPLLAGVHLPGLSTFRSRRLHRWVGATVVLAVVLHVLGLWVTSPPDVVDALFFVSPTPFSAWGVIAMWTLFAAALLATLRRRMTIRYQKWRLAHIGLAMTTVIGSVTHAMLVEGTMEIMSKTALCALVLLASARTLAGLRFRARGGT